MKRVLLLACATTFGITRQYVFSSTSIDNVSQVDEECEIDAKNLPNLIDQLFNNYPSKDFYKNVEKCFGQNIWQSIYEPEWAKKCLESYAKPKIKEDQFYSESLKNVIRILLVAFDGNNPREEKRAAGYKKRIDILKFITENVVNNSTSAQLSILNNRSSQKVENHKLYSLLNYFFGYECACYVVEHIGECIEKFGIPYSEESKIKLREKGVKNLFDVVWRNFKDKLSQITVGSENVLRKIIKVNGEEKFKSAIYHDWFCYFIQTSALMYWANRNTSLLGDISSIRKSITNAQTNVINTLSNKKLSCEILDKGWGNEKYQLRTSEVEIEDELIKCSKNADINKIVDKINKVNPIIKENIEKYASLSEQDYGYYSVEGTLLEENTSSGNKSNNRLGSKKEYRLHSNIGINSFALIEKDINSFYYLGLLNDIGTIKEALITCARKDSETRNLGKNRLLTEYSGLISKNNRMSINVDGIVKFWLKKLSEDIFLTLDVYDKLDFTLDASRDLENQWEEGKHSIFDVPDRLIKGYGDVLKCVDFQSLSPEDFSRLVEIYSKLVKIRQRTNTEGHDINCAVKYLKNCKDITGLASALYAIEKYSRKEISVTEFVSKLAKDKGSAEGKLEDCNVLFTLLSYIKTINLGPEVKGREIGNPSEFVYSVTKDRNAVIRFLTNLKNMKIPPDLKKSVSMYNTHSNELTLLGQTVVMILIANCVKGDIVQFMKNWESMQTYCEQSYKQLIDSSKYQKFCDNWLSEKSAYRKNDDLYYPKYFVTNMLLRSLSYHLFKDKEVAFGFEESLEYNRSAVENPDGMIRNFIMVLVHQLNYCTDKSATEKLDAVEMIAKCHPSLPTPE